MMISKKLFFVGCLLASCVTASAQQTNPSDMSVLEDDKIELLLVAAVCDDNGVFQAKESCHATPENVIDFLRAMVKRNMIPVDQRSDFAKGLLDVLYEVDAEA
jgi:hypothetical protein